MAERPRANERETRLILYVGKGGVGKTTAAAATAVRAAELGHRTLVISTDIAHSLGDVLDLELGAEPRLVGKNLDAQEVNVLEELRRSWGTVQAHLSELLRREGMSEIQADELAVMPGMDEVAALVQIGRKIRSHEYDCIVVDAAPTGETIRLLSTPESFQAYAGRMQGWRGRILGIAGPFLRTALPDLNVVDVLSRLAGHIKELREVLTNTEQASYRLVVTPDRMVLKEALRAETYLNVFNYPIDAVILNRLLPSARTGNAYLDALSGRQQEIAVDIRSAFATLPIFEAPLAPEEPIGQASLARLARQVFGERDPTEVMHRGPTQSIVADEHGYVLRLPMPNAEIGKLSLLKRGDALYVDLGNVRREITLPTTLAALEPGMARMRAGVLEVPFVRPTRSHVSVPQPDSEVDRAR
ncbi:MAG TPA: ArsA family ATPase [Chloroflexota bacterium]|nr:ArsA family ATPase [Chloroflexota bacterium]